MFTFTVIMIYVLLVIFAYTNNLLYNNIILGTYYRKDTFVMKKQ